MSRGQVDMRGLIGGMLTGGLVSVVGLGTVSIMTEQPAGITPPEAPLIDAPHVSAVEPLDDIVQESGDGSPGSPAGSVPDSPADNTPDTPVGSMTVVTPSAPDLPAGEGAVQEPAAPVDVDQDASEPRADTDPLDVPDVVSVEGAMASPDTPDVAGMVTEPDDPVFPNPQSQAPQTPSREADLTVSTAPAQPTIVVPDEDPAAEAQEADLFVVDLGADAAGTPEGADGDQEGGIVVNPDTEAADFAVLPTPQTAPAIQFQGDENSLLSERDTGVTVMRPDTNDEDTAPVSNALTLYGAEVGALSGKPLLSIVLIDDGSMTGAFAAITGLPFPITIALDPADADVGGKILQYRAAGFEVAAMAMVPEGAVPTDVEVAFESVFNVLPESIAVLDIGDGGMQADRDVTQQAMQILADQGRGFITTSQGLNMASRAADAAGVPDAIVYRDIDIDGQDARVVRRFLDQAAFRARQESGVVLVGRVRPDTLSALILWGTANQDGPVELVPVSTVLLAQ